MAIQNSSQLPTSRYVHGGVTEVGQRALEWWERNTFPNDSSDFQYAVENFYEGALHRLSAAVYGNPRYQWLIAQYNNIIDPFTEVTPGRVLFLPTKERLNLMLNGKVGGIPSTREGDPRVISPVVV